MNTQITNTAVAAGAKGLKAIHLVLILGVVTIAAATVVAVVILTKPEPAAAENWTPVIDANNVDQILAEVQEKVNKGYFETHMTTEWTFPDGESPSSDAIMGNSANNNYPFWFTVTLQDGTVVYTSSLLPVGTIVKEIILEKDLDAGQYPATLKINMVEEDGTPIESNAAFNITLYVQN